MKHTTGTVCDPINWWYGCGIPSSLLYAVGCSNTTITINISTTSCTLVTCYKRILIHLHFYTYQLKLPITVSYYTTNVVKRIFSSTFCFMEVVAVLNNKLKHNNCHNHQRHCRHHKQQQHCLYLFVLVNVDDTQRIILIRQYHHNPIADIMLRNE
ncbi:hypothetical protein FF38_11779 [Lucilia cuprina]|uniref:Uncharacterized protein n=1 Tax=Lucilia cuprina TaxID=7375 RepID=A0A0L0BPB8_LUCCU|nr:hypothetical protein FF38_11779 [Lucilia cuprina]